MFTSIKRFLLRKLGLLRVTTEPQAVGLESTRESLVLVLVLVLRFLRIMSREVLSRFRDRIVIDGPEVIEENPQPAFIRAVLVLFHTEEELSFQLAQQRPNFRFQLLTEADTHAALQYVPVEVGRMLMIIACANTCSISGLVDVDFRVTGPDPAKKEGCCGI